MTRNRQLSKQYLRLIETLVNLPTAPFVETAVADFIRDFVKARPALKLKRDRFGNLLVKYDPARKSKQRGRPLLFAAHMDHPGFIADGMTDDGLLRAQWHGGVRGGYFKGSRVKFWCDDGWRSGTIVKTIANKTKLKDARYPDPPPKEVHIKMRGSVPRGAPGMWGLPDARVSGKRLSARVCDDIAGLAAVLAMLDQLCTQRAKAPAYGFFTRAEEVGFGGALAALDGGTVPKRALVVVVECSKVIPGVEMGAGPVLRVGDRASVFSPATTAYCQVVADQLVKDKKQFSYQRKLMDGGTCEATPYCVYGYDATCICLPLMNYHNMDTAKGKIAPEKIDTRDYLNLIDWFVALAQSPGRVEFGNGDPAMNKRLDGLLKKHRRRLETTAGR